jgi:hypothetical protein
MRTMLSACLIAYALVLHHTVAVTDEPRHRKAAEELLLVMQTEKTLQEAAQELLASVLRQDPQLAQHGDVLQKFVHKHVSWASVKEDMITIYAQEFTEKELKQLTAFYQTPVGQKAVEKLPELTMAGTELGITRLRAHQAELRQMIDAEKGKSK